VRWLRLAWRHGYAILAALSGLAVFGYAAARAGPMGRTAPGDWVAYGLVALLTAGAVYGVAWAIDAAYRAGILRGGR
jgi:hypothetical protein